MRSFDDSWDFLQLFLDNDQEIKNVINKYAPKSFAYDCGKSYSEFIKDRIRDFNINDDNVSDVEELEKCFMKHFWEIIQKKAGFLIPHPSDDKSIPYLILIAHGISFDWFLYNEASLEEQFEKNKDKFFESIRRGVAYCFKKGFFCRKDRTKSGLFLLVVFLIILRSEYVLSSKKNYITLKLNYLKLKDNTLQNKYANLILGLYNMFEKKDKDKVFKYTKELEFVKIHSIIAKEIIKNQGYDSLFENLYVDDKNVYKYSEESVKGNCKRLMVDYCFPYNKIRKDDCYIPHFLNEVKRIEDRGESVVDELKQKAELYKHLLDLIYISFHEKEHYEEFYREPGTRESFDIIQIKKENFAHVEYYRSNLGCNGNFLVVKSKSEIEKDDAITVAFSDFRHDLKAFLDNSAIINFGTNLERGRILEKQINRFIKMLEDYSSNKDFYKLTNEAKNLWEEIKEERICDKSTFKSFKYIEQDVKNIRSGKRPDDSLKEYLEQLKATPDEIYEVLTSNLNKILYNFDTIVDYISVAGLGKIDQSQKKINLKEEIEMFVKMQGKVLQDGIELTSDFNDLSDITEINYNKIVLRIMLSSIVDNAVNHGFAKGYSLSDTKKICIKAVEEDGYMVLKICNNGRPIDITTKEYKTKGVFSGITGHTGIGGYQVSKYAESQGGKIEVFSNKDNWGTQICIYIKI